MSEEPIAVIHATTLRRYIGVLAVCGLGVLLLMMGISNPDNSIGSKMLLVAFGLLALLVGLRTGRATAREIYLTQSELRDSTGIVIAALDNIKSVDRGVFAFKPSNGFVLRLHKGMSGQWHPGLWWRLGTRVGVGGVTSGAQSKIVADLIAQHLMETPKE